MQNNLETQKTQGMTGGYKEWQEMGGGSSEGGGKNPFDQILLVVGLDRECNPNLETTRFTSLQHMVRP